MDRCNSLGIDFTDNDCPCPGPFDELDSWHCSTIDYFAFGRGYWARPQLGTLDCFPTYLYSTACR